MHVAQVSTGIIFSAYNRYLEANGLVEGMVPGPPFFGLSWVDGPSNIKPSFSYRSRGGRLYVPLDLDQPFPLGCCSLARSFLVEEEPPFASGQASPIEGSYDLFVNQPKGSFKRLPLLFGEGCVVQKLPLNLCFLTTPQITNVRVPSADDALV